MNFLNKFKVFIVFLISFLITSCSVNASDENVQSTAIPANGTLEVHYIDVGQADCSLIKLPDGYNAVSYTHLSFLLYHPIIFNSGS